MTIAKSFICPACKERVVHLKFQIDDSIRWRPWPFSVVCDNCGDVINGELNFSKKTQKIELNNYLKKGDYAQEGIVMGYCNTLPTPAPLYFQRWSNPGLSSVFLNIANAFGDAKVVRYGAKMRMVERCIVRRRLILPALFPLLRGQKTNVAAFRNKVKDLSDIKIPDEDNLKNPKDCYDMFQHLQLTVRECLSLDDNYVAPFFNKMIAGLPGSGSDELNGIVAKVSGSNTSYASELLRKACRGLNENLVILPKLLPAFFLDIVTGNDSQLRLVTASEMDITGLYKKNFNLLVKFLPIVMSIYNYVVNGDADTFVDADGNETSYTMSDFMKINNDGTRLNLMMMIPELQTAMEGAFNHHIRNGIDHEDYDYDYITQVCIFRDGRGNRPQEYPLIRLAHMCLIQVRWLAQLCRLLWHIRG